MSGAKAFLMYCSRGSGWRDELRGPCVHVAYHRFQADGQRFPHGWTGRSEAHYAELPAQIRKDLAAYELEAIKEIERREAGLWQELGITGIEVVEFCVEAYARDKWEQGLLEEMSVGLSLEYRRLGLDGNPLKSRWKGAIIWVASPAGCEVNHGDLESYEAHGKVAQALLNRVIKGLEIATRIAEWLEAGGYDDTAAAA